MENQKLLVIANAENSSIRRLAYVSTFSASHYFNMIGKKLKSFNPILGETFEIITDNFRYISEQVNYRPGIFASHSESNDYIIEFQTRIEGKVLNDYLEYKQLGSFKIKLKKWEEEYIITRPNLHIQNPTGSTLYFDCTGKSTIDNNKTKERCIIEYYQKGWNNSTYGLIEGYLCDIEGKRLVKIQGKWSESIWISDLSTNKAETIWKSPPKPKDHDENYCLTPFGFNISEANKELIELLPPTDSRLRPDRKALSEGNIKLAAYEKYRLEELQRKGWKERKDNKTIYSPIYFDEEIDPITKEKIYKFNGKYWKDRELKKWENSPKIY